MIIVDTREQLPIWDEEHFDIKRQKLDEGDITTEELHNIAHIERKSGADLYGSIIQGHERFTKEIKRAREKKIKLVIMVECPEEDFYAKKFKNGYRRKTPSLTLKKIITTMKIKYDLEFVWCNGRKDFREQALLWFVEQKEKIQNAKNTGNK